MQFLLIFLLLAIYLTLSYRLIPFNAKLIDIKDVKYKVTVVKFHSQLCNSSFDVILNSILLLLLNCIKNYYLILHKIKYLIQLLIGIHICSKDR